jgi:hypothetical protein
MLKIRKLPLELTHPIHLSLPFFVFTANYGNNIRKKGNSDTYKYRCEAREAPTGARSWAVAHFAHPLL